MITVTPAWLQRASDPRTKPVFRFTISGYSRTFSLRETGKAGEQPWIANIDSLRQSVDDLRGQSSLGDLTVDVLDKDGAITNDFGAFVFEGKDCALYAGYYGLKDADFALLFSGQIDSLEYNSGLWSFVCKDTNRLVKKVIYTTGDDGSPTSADHPKTVQGNPMQILLDVLQTQVGLSAGEIDSTTIQNYRDSLFAGFRFFFQLTTAPEAKDFLEKEIFAPLGGYAFVKPDGKYSVRFFWPLPGTVVAAQNLDENSCLGKPKVETSELVNVVKHRFDWDGEKFLAESLSISATSEAKYGQQGAHEIESRGMRSALFGFSTAQFASRGFFFRYGDKNPKLQWPTFWRMTRLELGDFVDVSHRQIADRRSAKLGMSHKLFEVVERTLNFNKGTVDLLLIDAEDVKKAQASVFYWAPDSVADFTLASAAEQARYMFFASKTTGNYSNGVPGHTLV